MEPFSTRDKSRLEDIPVIDRPNPSVSDLLLWILKTGLVMGAIFIGVATLFCFLYVVGKQ